ncbi:hypothetical protein O3M35_005301 [Rhynocoris fuscipes]|uniref:Uncharacterized protein n=1 Tax=Rhynocoris fuscipes TaxID=488301 RepID=A0AAW1DPZ5_9HEMI
MLKLICMNKLGRKLLNIKLQLNTFRNDRIRTKNVFYATSGVAPLFSRWRPKTNQS